jgi:arabinogalactan oligomer/maltooligosaccharide transport system permease protein
MRKKMMNIALILGMFPSFLSMIALYYIMKGLGFMEAGQLKQLALVIVYSAGAGLGFYVAKGFFDTIPKTIDEAAFIDGATKWDVFRKITIPLSRPIIVNTLLTAFMGPWVDYLFARVILGQDRQYYTVAVGLWSMLQQEFLNYYYTTFFAGCVIISIPIAILFLMTQRFYVEGLSGSVKG